MIQPVSATSADVAIIGAGAAGLAAAKTLRARGLSVAMFEASPRIGGRAHTDRIGPGLPWDRGAYWLHHSEDNFFARYAKEAGFPFDETPRNFRMRGPAGWSDTTTLRERDVHYEAAFDAVDRAGEAGRDVACSEVIPDHPRFGAMFSCWYAAIAGNEPELCSTLDQYRYRDGVNLRVRPGYGALIAAYGADVPVALSTPVERVRWGGTGVEIDSAQGTLRARAVIVTASTTALARGSIRFDPALPATVTDAIASVPLGTAEKVCIAFERDVFNLPENTHVHPEHAGEEAIRFHIRPGGHAIALGYLAGRFAARIEADGTRAMVDFAERALADIFGSDILKARIAADATHWRGDPFIGGGYSAALPGAAESRKILLEPVGERIFFAGEACSVEHFGTVNGAYDSGVAAAEAVARALAPA